MRTHGRSKFSRIWAKFYLLKAELTKQALFSHIYGTIWQSFQICIVHTSERHSKVTNLLFPLWLQDPADSSYIASIKYLPYICLLRSPAQFTFNVPPSSFKITWLHSPTLQQPFILEAAMSYFIYKMFFPHHHHYKPFTQIISSPEKAPTYILEYLEDKHCQNPWQFKYVE